MHFADDVDGIEVLLILLPLPLPLLESVLDLLFLVFVGILHLPERVHRCVVRLDLPPRKNLASCPRPILPYLTRPRPTPPRPRPQK